MSTPLQILTYLVLMGITVTAVWVLIDQSSNPHH